MPTLTHFINEEGVDVITAKIEESYKQINWHRRIVEEEMGKIRNDKNLKHLIKG